MKLICERDALDRALKFVLGCAEGKSLIPILKNVLLKTISSRLTLTTTDLSTRMESFCGAEVETGGATTLDADRFARLIGGMQKGSQVLLTMDGTDMKVRCGRSTYMLPTLPEDEFPIMSEPKEPVEFTLPAASVKRLFGEPPMAITITGARKHIEGGHLHCHDGQIGVAGTDGIKFLRLCLPSEVRFDGRYTIPKDAMAEIVKLATEGEITFRCGENLIEVRSDRATFTSKLLEGEYPDFRRMIPALGDTFMTVARDEISDALKRLCGLATEFSTIALTWRDGDSHIEMTTSGEGSGVEQIGCECLQTTGRVAFAPKVIADVLGAFSGELLQLHTTEPSRPMRIVDADAPELTVVIASCAPRNAPAEQPVPAHG